MRSRDLENLHDQFLDTTRAVYNLDAELADLRTELIVSLGDDEALDGVCSYKRSVKEKFDRGKFVRDFPDQAVECAKLVGLQLRKRVYPSRSYRPSGSEHSYSL